MSIVYNYMLYFFIYSFLGWVCESIYCSCLQKKVINRGFLNGPVCPVYGVGALIIITGLWSYRDSMIAVFVMGVILTSLLEYVTATILEKLFHAKWWDYSKHKFNINGKVCLLNSTMFGFMSLFVIEVLHPFVIDVLSKMNSLVLFVFLILAMMCMIGDLVVTAKALNSLTVRVDALASIVDDMKKIHAKFKLYEDEEFLRKLKISPEEVAQRLKAVSEKYG
ncbi:MAG: putative ABC transporter permease, partial [Intestinibacter bartlettii]